MAVLGDAVIDDALSNEALNNADINLSSRSTLAATDSTDRFRGNIEERR
jgi:hypothetical protein